MKVWQKLAAAAIGGLLLNKVQNAIEKKAECDEAEARRIELENEHSALENERIQDEIYRENERVKRERERLEAEKLRQESWKGFEDEISESDFKLMVAAAKKGINRLVSLTSVGPVVYGTVLSESGDYQWDFQVDFNDFGQITGTYYVYGEQKYDAIVNKVANTIKGYIENFPFEYIDDEADDCLQEIPYTEFKFCPNCGREIVVKGSKFCTFCGKALINTEI